ncbi:TPA: hypothetical protein DEP96_02160 [Candidatus Uhrbacteria bacterium]|nr:hypothetical protein [Candidatus Uhrbacteria bacterium]
MFTLPIASTLVVFSKFFSVSDRDAVLAAIPEGTRRVVFLDTPATAFLAPTIEGLLARGVEIEVRDHHDCPAAAVIRGLVPGAVISTRDLHPACSTLLQVGEFAGRMVTECDCKSDWSCGEWHNPTLRNWPDVIVADPDPDGLTAAMKAAGVFYPGLDEDAAVLDGPRAAQTADRLSPVAFLLTRGMSTLPGFDPARPQVSEEAKGKLFAEFVAAAGGDVEALASLGRKVEIYEEGVREALLLANEVTDLLPGVAFVDVTGGGRFDLTTLASRMDARPGVAVTVQRKSAGPIAAKCGGIQISLAVPKPRQTEINLQDFLPVGFTSSPEAGVISNTTFLLHVSQQVWDEAILPALVAKFGG